LINEYIVKKSKEVEEEQEKKEEEKEEAQEEIQVSFFLLFSYFFLSGTREETCSTEKINDQRRSRNWNRKHKNLQTISPLLR
jgi:hypothetical protein